MTAIYALVTTSPPSPPKEGAWLSEPQFPNLLRVSETVGDSSDTVTIREPGHPGLPSARRPDATPWQPLAKSSVRKRCTGFPMLRDSAEDTANRANIGFDSHCDSQRSSSRANQWPQEAVAAMVGESQLGVRPFDEFLKSVLAQAACFVRFASKSHYTRANWEA